MTVFLLSSSFDVVVVVVVAADSFNDWEDFGELTSCCLSLLLFLYQRNSLNKLPWVFTRPFLASSDHIFFLKSSRLQQQLVPSFLSLISLSTTWQRPLLSTSQPLHLRMLESM
jgi:hypothetical protein